MPRRLRRRPLPGWRDPELVHLELTGDSPVSAWLDSGIDASSGTSVVAVPRDGAAILVADDGTPPAAVFERLRGELGDPVDASAGATPLGWFGWFGYEFGARALGLPAAPTRTPAAALFFAERAVVFDHAARTMRLEWLEDEADPAFVAAQASWLERTAAAIAALPVAAVGLDPGPAAPAVAEPRWRHSPEAYRRRIRECQEAIARGDAYQLCLTNRIDVDGQFDPVELYRRLRRTSRSHHGGLLRFGSVALVSASPEQFLLVEPGGLVSTKPMKGTRPRHPDPERDAALRAELLASEKERAENLMIVDLMRNDLSRVAELGSVRVSGLHTVEEYPQVHQLVSTVSARLRPGLGAVDALAAAFPAGSMTGAPKEGAMRILHELEAGERGVYSGAFGTLSVDGGADLAMVIRSIVVTPAGASIGTGGGITALSVADEEVEETRVKARALLEALGAAPDAAIE
ncbi:anthranilate synthase component I family protein [Agromyces mediolanus]|uniref:anthranilate synthase component I family protein n=1 Tax=Agromyces mediolanus TaxID=41986 RepID=UPI0020408986|nr:anthranilate synthase component I family protein [Agromyces mediolanus]MCM3658376.1 anthranilate synthase component I family protein [Agromyces mediolanus]